MKIEDFRLKVFATVVGQGSFTKAAKALKISQPAVSQNISELEKAVGEPLLERNRGEVSLTDAGKIFFEYSRKIDYWYGRINSELVEKTSVAPFGSEVELSDGRRATVSADGDNIVINVH